ncbi:hypothetical protein ACIOD1_05225 [Streptomyces sp. NPDC088097]|uniref:hypothetical protein n=1 Tax=Streptomyces sp. NPDC088097 TaxID=3365823 RepID=UPI0038084A14
MARPDHAVRRLVVEGRTFHWSVRHVHHVRNPDGSLTCHDTLNLRLPPHGGRLRVVFPWGRGRILPGVGWVPGAAGAVPPGERVAVNLHEPGTARAVVDRLLEDGWDPEDRHGRDVDGWDVSASVSRWRQE